MLKSFFLLLCCPLLSAVSGVFDAKPTRSSAPDTNAAPVPLRPGKDFALFIAVKDYDEWTNLDNPVSDCEKIAAELQANYGFDAANVTLVRNKTRTEILAAIDGAYARAYTDDAQLLIFFSGHGHWDERKCKGYFVPRDGKKNDPSGASYISYQDLHGDISSIPCRHILLAVDACFGGTFDAAMGCAKIKGDDDTDRPNTQNSDERADFVRLTLAPESRIFVSSIGKETTSDNSRFARRWLEALQKGADYRGLLTAFDLRARLRTGKEVFSNFGGFHNSDAFVFVKNIASKEPSVAEMERLNWQETKKKDNIEAYRAFKTRYPDSDFTALADDRIRDLDETVAWAEAKRVNTREAYQNFLNRFPQSDYADLARKRLSTPNNSTTPLQPTIPDGMVWVKGGTFMMGSPATEKDRSDDETQHSVTVNSFYVGKYEVTVAEFKKFIESTAYETDADKGGSSYVYVTEWKEQKGVNWKCDTRGNLRPSNEYNHPVVHVSWNDATEYCKWLSKSTGKKYRLPTEAEWEYAAAGGANQQHTQWAGTDDKTLLHRYANTWGNQDGYATTAPVGSLQANALGLHDMSGNVWEWCSDWYGAYPTGSKTDPKGADKGVYRVLRGGGWGHGSQFCRAACRVVSEPDYRRRHIGFRLALQ